MILVDDAGGDWPMIAHAPWEGCNLADFVMPFFLFIVGVSIALSFKVNFITRKLSGFQCCCIEIGLQTCVCSLFRGFRTNLKLVRRCVLELASSSSGVFYCRVI